MKKRCNLWMADWRDKDGKRHRKGFPTKQAAAHYARKKQAEAAEKKDRASGR